MRSDEIKDWFKTRNEISKSLKSGERVTTSIKDDIWEDWFKTRNEIIESFEIDKDVVVLK